MRRAPSPLEAARVCAPLKRPVPRESSAADPSPFKAACSKQACGSEAVKEAVRKTREDREWPKVPRNVRRCIMPHFGDFPPYWDMFACHFATPLVDPSHPRFPQKW